MAGRELRANIVIGGKADNSFLQLGSAIEGLGQQVDGISRKLIDFGKESVDAYVSYEDAMLGAEVALSTQYTNTRELSKVMEQLDKQALQWANNSRFNTDDVANAINNAAHAGWDFEQIMSGVPVAMKLSQAGGMELATGLEYLVDIANATGVSFEQIPELANQIAYAGDASNATIEEMLRAMQRMGSTMQFVKGDTAGLTTMLAMLANTGTKGTEAGTLLRNSMIRLIAPTEKAAEAMGGLQLTTEDLNDIYANPEGLAQASELLKEAGFSAYESNGDLKNFLTIWQELDKATTGMTEEERNSVLTAIFPTRTITGALALLEAAGEGWDGLYEKISENDSYLDYASETMESGLGGTLRRLESVYNMLQTRTGSELEDDVGGVAGFLTDVVSAVNGLDDDTFSAVVSGLEVIAAAGPGLVIAGGAIKGIGALAATGPIGKLFLMGIALTAVARGLNDLNEAAYEDQFGELSLDESAIAPYVTGLGEAFSTAQADIDLYNSSVQTALSDYETASSTFKESLITKMLTGATLTPENIKELNTLGDQMRQALIAGIDGSYSAAEEAVAGYAGKAATEVALDDSIWGSIMDTLNYGYETAIAEAEALSEKLRNAMTSAFTDGSLTSEEINDIQNIINQQNELLAIQADAQNKTERQKLLRQAQTLGLEGLSEISGMAQTQRDAELATLEDNYWQTYYQTQLGGEMKIRDGVKKADGTLYTQEDLDRELEYLYSGDPNDPNDGYLGQRQAQEAAYDRFLLDLYGNAIAGSELYGAWTGLGNMADQYLATGALTDTALQGYRSAYDQGERDDVTRFIGTVVDALGGYDSVSRRADYYAQTGDLESANLFRRLLTMDTLSYASTPGQYLSEGETARYSASGYTIEDARKQNEALIAQDDMTLLAWDYLDQAMQTGLPGDFANLMSGNVTDTGFQTGIDNMVASLKEAYDLSAVEIPKGLESIGDYAAAYRLLFDETINAEDYRIPVTPEVDQTGLSDALGEVTVPVAAEVKEGELSGLEDEELTANVDGDTTELAGAIQENDQTPLTAVVDADTSALAAGISQYDGSSITVHVNYSGSAPSGVSGGSNKSSGSSSLLGKLFGFAEGGRAEEASIFGEAGPEWAIPEEHSQRTAELLNAAREASGFTWPELLSRNGGLNAGSQGARTIIYSPTIVANDATGVEQKLIEDKARLEEWWEEKQMREDVEVYA